MIKGQCNRTLIDVCASCILSKAGDNAQVRQGQKKYNYEEVKVCKGNKMCVAYWYSHARVGSAGCIQRICRHDQYSCVVEAMTTTDIL